MEIAWPVPPFKRSTEERSGDPLAPGLTFWDSRIEPSGLRIRTDLIEVRDDAILLLSVLGVPVMLAGDLRWQSAEDAAKRLAG